MDEARLGLKPIVRRVWAPRGKRPLARQRQTYQWLWLYGFVEPSTGHVEWRILPSLNKALFEIALRELAESQKVGPNRRLILVLDRAGAHQHVAVPEGNHLVYQPAHSPELQPAERLWPLVREALANRLFETLDAIEDAIVERCRQLDTQTERIRRLVGFQWWIDALMGAF